MIVDMRCPKCNQILKGKQEVVIRKVLPRNVKSCDYCKTALILVQTSDDIGGYHFTSLQTSLQK